jgi:hypothetical protein
LDCGLVGAIRNGFSKNYFLKHSIPLFQKEVYITTANEQIGPFEKERVLVVQDLIKI